MRTFSLAFLVAAILSYSSVDSGELEVGRASAGAAPWPKWPGATTKSLRISAGNSTTLGTWALPSGRERLRCSLEDILFWSDPSVDHRREDCLPSPKSSYAKSDSRAFFADSSVEKNDHKNSRLT